MPAGVADYLLLLEACLMTVYEAASSGKSSDVDLATCLAGIQALLGAQFMAPAFCSRQLCREAVTAVGALFHQVDGLLLDPPNDVSCTLVL